MTNNDYFQTNDAETVAFCTDCGWQSDAVNGYAAMVSAWTDHLRDEHPRLWLDC